MRSTERRSGALRMGAGLGLAASVLLGPVAAHGQDDAARVAALFEHPTALVKVPPASGDDPVGEILCSYYPDLMVRENGTDTPDPSAATLLPLAAGAVAWSHRLCAGAVMAGRWLWNSGEGADGLLGHASARIRMD